MALDPDVIPASEKDRRDLKIFQQIVNNEADHLKFLITGLKRIMNLNFAAKFTFNFIVGNAFDHLNTYPAFLALAQVPEDTGVRAYIKEKQQI